MISGFLSGHRFTAFKQTCQKIGRSGTYGFFVCDEFAYSRSYMVTSVMKCRNSWCFCSHDYPLDPLYTHITVVLVNDVKLSTYGKWNDKKSVLLQQKACNISRSDSVKCPLEGLASHYIPVASNSDNDITLETSHSHWLSKLQHGIFCTINVVCESVKWCLLDCGCSARACCGPFC